MFEDSIRPIQTIHAEGISFNFRSIHHMQDLAKILFVFNSFLCNRIYSAFRDSAPSWLLDGVLLYICVIHGSYIEIFVEKLFSLSHGNFLLLGHSARAPLFSFSGSRRLSMHLLEPTIFWMIIYNVIVRRFLIICVLLVRIRLTTIIFIYVWICV